LLVDGGWSAGLSVSLWDRFSELLLTLGIDPLPPLLRELLSPPAAGAVLLPYCW
jgi:hypothetical protein